MSQGDAPRAAAPSWAEVDLAAVAWNLAGFRRMLGRAVKIMAVVKADAYGHGAVRVARAALSAGAAWLGVAHVAEGLALRKAGIEAPCLVLGAPPCGDIPGIVSGRLRVAVSDLGFARALSCAAESAGATVPVHLKVDTGMGRLGVAPDEAVEVARVLRSLPGIEVEGVFSHLATADEPDKTYAEQQTATFRDVLVSLGQAGMRPALAHLANSAAVLDMAETTAFDMVRIGISLYGLYPSPHVRRTVALRPAMTWKSRVSRVRVLPAGHGVSYGRLYVTDKPTRVATVSVGYADGYPRVVRGAEVLLPGGCRAPVIGRVCMDMIMVDASGAPGLDVDDDVVLMGARDGQCIGADDLARWAGTINYEVVTRIGGRVPRFYVGCDIEGPNPSVL